MNYTTDVRISYFSLLLYDLLLIFSIYTQLFDTIAEFKNPTLDMKSCLFTFTFDVDPYFNVSTAATPPFI